MSDIDRKYTICLKDVDKTLGKVKRIDCINMETEDVYKRQPLRRGSRKREDPRRRRSREFESRLRNGTGGMYFRYPREENRCPAETL